MALDEEIAAFVEGAVMIIIGSTGAAGEPEIARGVGVSADRAAGTLDLLVSSWQWPETIANLRVSRRIAVTFARPADYESYQIKGDVLAIAATGDVERTRAGAYIARMTGALVALGVEPGVIAPWQSDADLVRVRVMVAEIFVQTPGAQAGQLRRVPR
jgi:hypothetical protein